MSFGEFFSNPIVCGVTSALATWSIMSFWSHLLIYKRKYYKLAMFIMPILNGLMAVAAEIYTTNNASPRTISLYMPIMVVLMILTMGYMGKWGTFVIFVLTSFQFITLFSVSIGIVNILTSMDFIVSREGLVVPVTLMNIGMMLFLSSINFYRSQIKRTRDFELSEILSSPKSSRLLILYAAVNSVAVTILCYSAIAGLYDISVVDEHVTHICVSMIVRDSILFFSTILMLDIQSRTLQAENDKREALEKNLKLQSEVKTEKELRDKLHHNVLFRFTANISTQSIIETGALKIFDRENYTEQSYLHLVDIFTDLIIHPDNRKDVKNFMNPLNLLKSIDKKESLSLSFKMSPAEFINHVHFDEEHKSMIYAYSDREYIWSNMTCSLAHNDDGDVLAYFYIMDVDEQKQHEETIIHAATTDALTGLLNRRAFEYNLEKYLTETPGASGTLFMFDLDYFKQVNDKLGHPQGDELLKAVGIILSNTFRTDDLVCRMGGDEFYAFAKGLLDEKLIINRAKELNQLSRIELTTPNNETIRVSFSIGICSYPAKAMDMDSLYKNVDSALYKAKENGRDTYFIY